MNQRQRAALADRYQSDGMAGSSPQKLLLAIFARIHRDLDTALGAVTTSQIETAHHALINAQELVHELRLALDPDAWPGANDLRPIYDYLLTLLVEANLHKSADLIDQCLGIIIPLEQTWIDAHQMLQEQAMAAPTSP